MTCVYAKNYMLIINNEVIYLNPEFIVGLEPYKDCETILHLSSPYYTNNNILIVNEDIHSMCRMLNIEE